jgi:hypothetical protein
MTRALIYVDDDDDDDDDNEDDDDDDDDDDDEKEESLMITISLYLAKIRNLLMIYQQCFKLKLYNFYCQNTLLLIYVYFCLPLKNLSSL